MNIDLNVVLAQDMAEIEDHSSHVGSLISPIEQPSSTICEDDHDEQQSEEDDLIHPAVGMKFSSHDEAYHFYNDYAKRYGFRAVRRTNHNKGGVSYRYTFVCNRHKKVEENSSEIPYIPERNRPVLANDCKAMMIVADREFVGLWTIEKVNVEHNHELVPDSSFCITTHRDIPPRFKKELETNNDQGIESHKNIEMVIEHAGGYIWMLHFYQKRCTESHR